MLWLGWQLAACRFQRQLSWSEGTQPCDSMLLPAGKPSSPIATARAVLLTTLQASASRPGAAAAGEPVLPGELPASPSRAANLTRATFATLPIGACLCAPSFQEREPVSRLQGGPAGRIQPPGWRMEQGGVCTGHALQPYPWFLILLTTGLPARQLLPEMLCHKICVCVLK